MSRYADVLVRLDALYAQLPQISCQRLCQDACGVIVMTRLEWVRIQRRLGYKPKGKPSLVCPMLKQGVCCLHAIRPTICRLFGLMDMDKMRCPFGCVPERWMSEEEGYVWLAAVETLSQEVFTSEGPTAFAHGIDITKVDGYIQQAKREGTIR